MILGLSTSTFTLVHVAISLIGIASGLVALYGLLSSRALAGWTLLFIATTAATNLTGFLFPFNGITPAIAVVALYFNVFVLVVQAFLKIPSLHELAPKGSEPPFAIAQGVVLVAFIAFGILSAKRFHPQTL